MNRYKYLLSSIFPLIFFMLCFTYAAVASEEAEADETFFKKETVEVPIVMYHLVTNNSKLHGKWGISPSELESDLKWLKENGYETVLISDLINFVEKSESLPDKPIILTFDDGNSSDYHYLLPLLQKYDQKAVVSVLGKFVDDCTVLASKVADDKPKRFPNLTWDEAKELHESNKVELQSHSYDLHGKAGSKQKKGESDEVYHQRLREDLLRNQERITEMTGAVPTAFTYPYGMISDSSQAVLEEMGFKSSLSCCVGVNVLKEGDKEGLYRLKRADRPSGVHISNLLQSMYEKHNKK